MRVSPRSYSSWSPRPARLCKRTDALVAALKSGFLDHVVLDVFTVGPLPSDMVESKDQSTAAILCSHTQVQCHYASRGCNHKLVRLLFCSGVRGCHARILKPNLAT